MSTRSRIAIGTLLLLLSLPAPAGAKGAPDKVTIHGAALAAQLEITDAQWLGHLAMDQFIDFDAAIEAPRNLGSSYELTRYYLVGAGTLKAMDAFVYYPPHAGGRGAVFYTGILDKQFILGGSPNDGRWFEATAAGDQAMRELLEAHGIRLAPATRWPALLNNSVAWVILGGLAAFAAAVSVRRSHRQALPIT
jgi:hypothetical protein